MRYISQAQKHVIIWSKDEWPIHLRGFLIKGRSVSLLGAGRIGQSIAFKLAALGAGPFYYTGRSRKLSLETILGARKVSIDSLFEKSMILINSLPLTRETRNIITSKLLLKLPENAVYVNVGRGGTEKRNAVVDTISKRRDLFFVLDVHPKEPIPNNDPRLNLLNNPRVLMTPHMTGYSYESSLGTTYLALLQAKHYLTMGCVWNPVNNSCKQCQETGPSIMDILGKIRRK